MMNGAHNQVINKLNTITVLKQKWAFLNFGSHSIWGDMRRGLIPEFVMLCLEGQLLKWLTGLLR